MILHVQHKNTSLHRC